MAVRHQFRLAVVVLFWLGVLTGCGAGNNEPSPSVGAVPELRFGRPV